ncbi:MAG: carbohydrate kinase family protein [Dehalococcoidia bacterium]
MSKIQVIGVGALNMDNIYKVERILEDGETAVDWMKSFPGGSAANTIYGLAKLGISTGFCGAVGDDAEGKKLLKDFEKAGTDTSRIVVKPKAKTGSALCFSDRGGRRSLYVQPGANSQFQIEDLDFDYINQAEIVHLASFANDRQFRLSLGLIVRLGKSVKLSFTPGTLYATKGLDILAPFLSRTHLLFTNQSEMKQMTRDDMEGGVRKCLKAGCRIVVVTLGKGQKVGKTTAVAYIRDAKNEYVIEPSSHSLTAEVDTTGAGDAFTAGFIYGLVKGKGLAECGRLGDFMAKLSISHTGARHGLPTEKDLALRYGNL